MTIHPTAIVSPKAQIHESVEIGPYSIIGEKVTISQNTRVGSHCSIEGNTFIGENCFIASYASVGLPPQDLSYGGEDTKVQIGNNVTLREFSTVHRGTAKGRGITSIDDDCFLMNYAHVGHDCQLYKGVVLANGVSLAGHVIVHRKANISALFLAHQFIEIGELAMVSGMTGSRKSIPPFVLADGRPARIAKINLVGLQRDGINPATIRQISEAYRLIRKKETREALREINERIKAHPELEKIVTFYENSLDSKRGIINFLTTGNAHV